MNLTVRVLGLTIRAITASTDDEAEVEPDGSGTTAATSGFVAELGDEVGLPVLWGEE